MGQRWQIKVLVRPGQCELHGIGQRRIGAQFANYRPGGMKVLGGAVILEKSLRPEDFAELFDQAILSGFASTQEFGFRSLLDGEPLKQWVYMLQAPKRMGGLGLLSAKGTSPLAYLASVADATRAMVEDATSCPAWQFIRRDLDVALQHEDSGLLPDVHGTLRAFWALAR